MEAEANLRDAADPAFLYRDQDADQRAGSGGRRSRPAIWSGRIRGVLATVVQDDPMQVLFSVTQREMLEARDSEVTGKVRARVRLANGSLYSEKGRIDFLDVQVNPRTDGQTVRAMFPNPDDILTSGQTVRVIIEEKGGDKVVVIPQSAVAIDQTGSYVFVVGQDNKVEQRRLRLGTNRDGARCRRGGAGTGRAGRRPGPAAHPGGNDRSAAAGAIAGRLTRGGPR